MAPFDARETGSTASPCLRCPADSLLAVGGAASFGPAVGDSLQPLANDLQSLVIPGAGHWLAEAAPEGRPRRTSGVTIAVNVVPTMRGDARRWA